MDKVISTHDSPSEKQNVSGLNISLSLLSSICLSGRELFAWRNQVRKRSNPEREEVSSSSQTSPSLGERVQGLGYTVQARWGGGLKEEEEEEAGREDVQG